MESLPKELQRLIVQQAATATGPSSFATSADPSERGNIMEVVLHWVCRTWHADHLASPSSLHLATTVSTANNTTKRMNWWPSTAEAGLLVLLQWAHANGCPWDESTCSH